MLDSIKDTPVGNDELTAARSVVDTLLKGRKALNMYPGNNPVYMDNLKSAFDKFQSFFAHKDNLSFRFSRDKIYYDSEPVYSNSNMSDNLAFLFYKDGIREITFNKGMSYDETEDLLKILATDFRKEAAEDDMVTLFWMRDFSHIKYQAEDITLKDDEDSGEVILQELKENRTDPATLKQAYDDSFENDDEQITVPIIKLTEDDHNSLQSMFEKDDEEKISKLFNILFEIYFDVERTVEYDDIVFFFMKSLEYSIRNGDVHSSTETVAKLRKIISDTNTPSVMKKSIMKILLFAGGRKMINILGEILETAEESERSTYHRYIASLDHHAIPPLMDLLSDTKSIDSVKLLTDALGLMVIQGCRGRTMDNQYIPKLLKGLKHPEWYVVSKTIDLLGRVGDSNIIEYIKKTAKHSDFRVRAEAVKALGDLGKDNVLDILREGLGDTETKVRKSSLSAIGNIGTSSAIKLIIELISSPSFSEKTLEEKKDYFNLLAKWNNKSTYDFCIKTIKKLFFFRRSSQLETKACAAYCLGLMGNKNALPLLNKCRTSRKKLLSTFSDEAINRIEHDKQRSS